MNHFGDLSVVDHKKRLGRDQFGNKGPLMTRRWGRSSIGTKKEFWEDAEFAGIECKTMQACYKLQRSNPD